LFVCLFATSRKNYRFDLRKNSARDVYSDKEELIKFWKRSASGSADPGIFEGFFNIIHKFDRDASRTKFQGREMGHFLINWLIALEKLIISSPKFHLKSPH